MPSGHSRRFRLMAGQERQAQRAWQAPSKDCLPARHTFGVGASVTGTAARQQLHTSVHTANSDSH